VVFDALASHPWLQNCLPDTQTTSQPIKRVIVSHYHADHFYGLQVFKALGAEIWAQRPPKAHPHEAAVTLRQRKEVLPLGGTTAPSC